MSWQRLAPSILPLLLMLWAMPPASAMQVTSTPSADQTTGQTTGQATAQISVEQKQNIQTMGYNAGFRDGTSDARSNVPFNFQQHPDWQNATMGYSANSGIDQSTWQYNFRAGYERGYADAYSGRSPQQAPAAGQTGFPAPQAPSASPSGAQPPATTGQTTTNGAHESGTIPTGTQLQLKLDNTLSTRSSNVGDTFTASVTQPVTASGGGVLVPAGSVVTGRVAQVQQPGTIGGQSQLQLQFEQLRLPDGHESSLAASLSGVETGGGIGSVIAGSPSTTEEGGVTRSKTRSTVGSTAATAAAGTIVGAIVGGGKGAGIGAAVGAGLGILLSSRTGNIDLPAGTPMTITLDRPVQVQ